MSELGDIETGMVNLLTAAQDGGSPVFSVVRGADLADRKVTLSQLMRELKPAAYVAYDQRGKSGEEDGDPRFSVWLAASSHRGGGEVRLGSADVRGAYALSDLAAAALHDAVISGDVRLALRVERTVSSDGKTLVLEQIYGCVGVASTTPATYDGQLIAGAESLFDVRIGPVETESVTFGFPGIAGSFEHNLGPRQREIVWDGQLRADDNGALNTIEAGLETYVADPTPHPMVDPWGRTYDDVLLVSFDRKGRRRVDRVTGKTVQDFVCRFRQLNPT